ncbi:MAG TPA: hypothetical protein VFT95_03475 [Micromonosporaceae bacterium]|nr:hypothetical protein [Micromonosporaceae bacterium]
MAVLRFTRFTADPADTENMLAKRAALVSAARNAFPGLIETQLARLDDETWIDIWRWNSLEEAQAAVRTAGSIPEVAAAVALARNVTVEFAEAVGDR